MFKPSTFTPLALSTLLALTGCANPGSPRAPSLHLPEVVSSLQAQRLGDQVVLTFTTPTGSTDNGTIHLPITAQLCRQQGAAACLPLQRQTVAAGPTRLVDTLPPALLTFPATLLAYRIELFNRGNRSAGPSPQAFTASGPAPAPAGTLHAASRATGAELTWQRSSAPGTMELHRIQNTPKAQQITLQAEASQQSDPGGFIDPTPLNPKLDAVQFTYVAQRTLALSINGHSVTLLGLPSPPVLFTFNDIFPPPSPTGLLAIPTLAPPGIDLSWEPSPAADLLGYNIYRRDPTGPFTRLNPQPLPAAAFRDSTAQPSRPYTYRVTALDRHHNESRPSPETTETITP